jgi:ATP-dependent DNA ligase
MDKEQVMLGKDGSLADLQVQGDFLWQPKWDGNRLKLVFENNQVYLITRSGRNIAERLPELVEATGTFVKTTGAKSFILDGEGVVWGQMGNSNLHLSNSRCAMKDLKMIQMLYRRTMPMELMLFDIMEWDGQRLEKEPFIHRYDFLKTKLQLQPPKLHLTPTCNDADQCWTDSVIHQHEEGVMRKTTFGEYVYDRSADWTKIKARERDVFHVCGYTAGEGWRAELFGALVLMDDQGKLRGRVGGGWSRDEAHRILQVLKQAPEMMPPFTEAEVEMPYKAIKTDLQVEVAYQGVEPSGKLRGPPQLVKWWMP